ncbi:MAG: AMP-binding protein [Lachnospiraceae bacterium]|nr:AMP-binding protein [Lachnospiraceae bacterium]
MITYNNTKTLPDLIERTRKEFENRVFYRFEKDDTIFEKGYGTYAGDVFAVAGYIKEQNEKYGHDTHAAILGRTSYEYLTVLMGVPCAGGVAIPMDIQMSIDNLVDSLKRADADILFIDIEFGSYLDILKEKCPFIKRYIALQSVKNMRCVPMIHRVYRGAHIDWKIKSDKCALIIYTSGTTGVSKGVMLSHGNLIDNLFSSDDQREVCLNVLPIHHIFCISGDLLMVLRYGSTLCQCEDTSKLIYYLQLFEPTVMRAVPMMAKVLINRFKIMQQQNPDKDYLEIRKMVFGGRLNRIVSGGGYLSPDLSEELLKAGINVAQGYGMSECSPKITAPDYERRDKLASVGHPVTGAIIRIVDGEIQIKSPSVMLGYYNEPELTAEAITEDGYLRTGDTGYIDDEDFLFLNGRIKNLIVLSNGENVSPEYIENKFDPDRLIADIVVYGDGDKLVAQVYPNYEYAQLNGIVDIQAELDRIMAEHNEELTTYQKITKMIIRNKPFVKTASKKIIRSRVEEELKEQEQLKTKLKPPVTDMQKLLFNLLARQLGTMEFSIDDDFYEIGLDSMGSTMFLSDLAENTDKKISLSELMDHSTIIALEEFFENQDKKNTVDLSPREVYPLTSMQMYFAYVIPGNTTGNLPFSFRMSKDTDFDRLKDAVYKVLDAHPTLKALVKPTETGYFGVYRMDDRVIDIPIEQIKDADAQEIIQNSIVGFNFRNDPSIVHIKFLESESHKYIFFDVAHFMGDGMTMNIIMEDLKKAYDGEPFEGEKDYTGFEYMLETCAGMKDGSRLADLSYVDSLMKGLRMSRSLINTDVEGADLTKGDNASIKRRFENLGRKDVVNYGREHGVSENAYFITAFNYMVSLFSGEDDVFCTSIHSGRTDSRYSRIACALFLTYFSRYTVKPHETMEELIRKTGKQILQTMKTKIPMSRASEMFFQFQGDILDVEMPGEGTERVHVQLDSLPFHLMVMYDDRGYYVELRYWKNRFSTEMAEIFVECFEYILKAMLEETSVRKLKYHLPKEVYPKGLYVDAGVLHEAAGRTIISGVEPDEPIRLYVLDETYNKKPYGAWGPLYIMNYEPDEYVESQQYPYGPGMVYNTGLIARVLPDNTVDFLHTKGRKVLFEGSSGRKYTDLAKAEEALMAQDGIKSAKCYMSYDMDGSVFVLRADVETEGDVDVEALKEKIKETYGDDLTPKYIDVV